MKIEIRLLQDHEAEMANDVYNKANGNKRPLSFFNWEFMQSPEGKAIYVIALDHEKEGANKIIGTQSVIPLRLMNNWGDTILTGKSEDTFVDPAYRGMKLFDKMYDLLFQKCTEAGIEYIWGFTYARKPFLSIGFSIPMDYLQGVLCFNWKRSYQYFSGLNPANTWKEKLKIFGMVSLSKINSLRFNFADKSENVYFISNERVEDKSLLIREINHTTDDLWTLLEDINYLNWRLRKNPYPNDFRELTLKDKNGKLLANAVYNIRPEGFAYICQVLFATNLDSKTQKRFLGKLLTSIQDAGVCAVRFWGFKMNPVNLAELELFKSLGFIFISKSAGLVWKKLNSGKNLEVAVQNIFFSRLFTQGNY